MSFICGMAFNCPMTYVDLVICCGKEEIGKVQIDYEKVICYETDIFVPDGVNEMYFKVAFSDTGAALSEVYNFFVFCINPNL